MTTPTAGSPKTHARNHRVPHWLVPAVLQAQEDPEPENNQPPESILSTLSRPWRVPRGLRERWPSPLTAAIITGAPFEQRSPLAHQLIYCATLTNRFLRRAL